MARKIKQDGPPLSFTKALRSMHDKGFTHIKVELEARLGRSGGSDPCIECRARGWNRCEDCSGRGYSVVDNSPSECTHCHGEGHHECRRCNGRGHTRGGFTDTWCRDFIMRKVSRDTARSIVFGEFYWDGSVDSEYTFTMPTLQSDKVLDVINAFKALGQEIGNGISIENAGLHIAALPSGTYPCSPGLLNQRYMRNFRKQVSKLLPALYFLGTHTETTRGLDYRKPYVSRSEKYSAIYTHGDTAIEYRVFDPCFDKPEAFYDKVEIIAQTLKYYSEAEVKPKYEKFNMYSLGLLTELYGNMENYDALLKTVKEIKPDKSFTSLKAERHFKISKNKIKAEMDARAARQANQSSEALRRATQAWTNQVQNYMDWLRDQFLRGSGRGRNLVLVQWMRANSVDDLRLRNNEAIRRRMVLENVDVFGIAPEPTEASVARRSPRTIEYSMRPAYVLTAGTELNEESGEYTERY